MRALVTGVAGFIGFHVALRLLDEGFDVIGIDNLNDYYDVGLKNTRVNILKKYEKFDFRLQDLKEKQSIVNIFRYDNPEYVIHLGAQAGVRYSLDNPYAYIESNIVGFLNVLEGCRLFKPKHLIYASSSSVYGLNRKLPFSVNDSVDHPVSFYAATKKSNELMAHTYSHLFNIPSTGLRFFTVYGPFGRPDMALFKFTNAILKGETIEVYNNGNMSRDFTYIDDVVESIYRLINHAPVNNAEWSVESGIVSSSSAPYKIYNIGNSKPNNLMEYISALEESIGIEAKKIFLPLQQGDVLDTYSDTSELYDLIKFKPSTNIHFGINRFVDWYKDFYEINK